jgi:hypothetical protein
METNGGRANGKSYFKFSEKSEKILDEVNDTFSVQNPYCNILYI